MHSLRAFFAGRRILFGLWVLLCAGALVVTVRLTVFMADPTQSSYSVLPTSDFLTRHSCFSAYVAAADRLGEPGARIYDPANYARNGDDATRRIPLGFFEQDQFEYPPTFLLLPKMLLVASHNFYVLRTLWYGIMVVVILGAMGLTAAWIGGRTGLVTALLIPAFWIAINNLLAIQMGNVQFVIFAMTIGAMIAFDEGRPALGGALLAFTIGTKLSPGVLLVFLLAQRRWREALFTAAFGAFYCIAVVAFAGVAPFHEFLTFQLPRLLSGEAFAFFKESFDVKASNLSIFGLPYKLEHLGLVQNADRIAPIASRLYLIALLVTTVVVARKALARSHDERAERAMTWMAILNLAIMQAPFLPPYGLLGTVWIMTLWAPLGRNFWRTAVLFVVGWEILTVVIPKPPWVMLAMGFVSTFCNLGINIAVLVRGWRQSGRTRALQPDPAAEPAPGPSIRAAR